MKKGTSHVNMKNRLDIKFVIKNRKKINKVVLPYTPENTIRNAQIIRYLLILILALLVYGLGVKYGVEVKYIIAIIIVQGILAFGISAYIIYNIVEFVDTVTMLEQLVKGKKFVVTSDIEEQTGKGYKYLVCKYWYFDKDIKYTFTSHKYSISETYNKEAVKIYVDIEKDSTRYFVDVFSHLDKI